MKVYPLRSWVPNFDFTLFSHLNTFQDFLDVVLIKKIIVYGERVRKLFRYETVTV